MSENSGDLSLGYMMGQSDGGGNSGGAFSGDGIWAFLLFALMFGNGGWSGMGGGGQALTRAELYDGFAMQNIDSAVRGVQQGICDSTYALSGSISSGFHGVDNAICNLGYNLQSGINGIGHQISDCCCQTGRAIDGVRYDMATGLCSLGNTIQSSIRDVIDNQNAGVRQLYDFMVNEKLASKDARIAELSNQVSQSNQSAVIGARIDAAVAEVLRRTGNDCPTAAYLVQPPTPVNFPTNGCGTVQFGGGGCGFGC